LPPFLPLQQIELQTTLSDIATSLFDCCLHTVPQELLLTATQYLVQKPLPLAPQLCCHCPLIVILLLWQSLLLHQNCCDAAS